MSQAKPTRKDKQAKRKKNTVKARVDSKGSGLSIADWVSMLLLIIVTAIAYNGSLDNDFTNWDDPGYVTENGLITGAPNAPSIWDTETFVMGNYHPLTMQTLAWDYERYGIESARGFHLMNLIYHILATLVLFLFIRSLTGGKWIIAAFTAAVFALHPMHVESVAWVASRKDQIYALFFFLSLWAYSAYVKKEAKNYAFLALAFIAFVLSILGKAMAAPLPLVLILVDYFLNRKINLRSLLEKIPFFAVSIYFGQLAIKAQASSAAISENFDFVQKVFFAGSSFVMYIVKFFVPLNLAAVYPYPKVLPGESLPGSYYFLTLVALSIVAVVIWSMRKTRVFAFGMGFYALTVALVLQIIAVGQAIMADRYTYLPYVGIAFIIGYFIDKIYSENALKKYRKMALGASGVFLVFLLLGTVNRVEVWQDTPTLFTDLIEKQPTVGLAYNNRGKYYASKLNDLNRALADLNKGIEVEPEYPNCYVNRGNIFGMQQRTQDAIRDYNTAIQLKPDYFDAYVNRAISYSILGDFEKALADYNRAIQLEPNRMELYFNRGYGYLDNGQPEKAIADFNQAIRINPSYGAAYLYRSQAHARLGNINAARNDAQQAKRLGEQVSNEYLRQLNGN